MESVRVKILREGAKLPSYGSVEAAGTAVGTAGYKKAHPDTGTIGNITIFDGSVIHFFTPNF